MHLALLCLFKEAGIGLEPLLEPNNKTMESTETTVAPEATEPVVETAPEVTETTAEVA